MILILANNADTEAAFYLSFRCLHMYPFRGFQYTKGSYQPFPCKGDFCRQLFNFANDFDSDQDRQDVGPDLDPNHLTL